MNPESYQQIQELFLQARGLAADARNEFLATIEPTLRSEVESLLASESRCGDFLERSLHPDQSTIAHQTTPLEARQSIGPYRLLQQIGEGGYGRVYMAEQLEPITRKVAIKLIKPGMDSKQILARFHAERQAIAMMDHPSIARVFDAGCTDSGSPYFVMELVKGVPIDQFCTTNQLTLPERLHLFLQVCHATHHAHQKGIIHRDLKPSNILVTMGEAEPVAKVIDFGIAKALDTRLTEQTLFTEYGQLIGTLEYMSPEQAEMSAVDIDTRSDVYSLGVILYQLLTGEPPITKDRLLSKGIFEIPRLIRETEPATPSAQMTSQALQSSRIDRKSLAAGVKGLQQSDLDWIVMKALSKDRRDRYDSARDLARDVERYCDGEAVDAHPPSVSYRVRKTLSRHRVAVFSIGLILVSALVGIGGLISGLRRALVAERLATERTRELATNIYSELIEAAWESVQEHDDTQASKLLASCLPDLRGWEWNFVDSQMRDQAHQLLRSSGRSPLRSISLSHSTNLAVAVLDNESIEIWNVDQGVRIENLTDVVKPRDACFTPDASTLVVGTANGQVITLAVDSWQRLNNKTLAAGGIYDLAISDDGSRVAVCTGGGWMEVLDLPTLHSVHKQKLPERSGSLLFLDGNHIAVGSLSGDAYMIDLQTEDISRFSLSDSDVNLIDVTDQRNVSLLTAGRLMRIDMNQPESEPREILLGDSVASALASDGPTRVLVGCGDGTLYSVDLTSDESTVVAEFGIAITAIGIGKPEAQYWVALSDGRMLNVDRRDPAGRWLTETQSSMSSGLLLPKLQAGIALFDDGSIRSFDLQSGRMGAEQSAHTGGIRSVSTDRHESMIATVGEDQKLRVWDLPDFKLRFEHSVDWGVRDVCVAPDGKWIAAAPPLGERLGLNEGAIGLWDAKSGEFIRLLEGHDNWVLRFATTDDGTTLVSSDENRVTRIWDTNTGAMRALIRQPDHPPAEHVVIDPTNGYLYLGHRDGIVTAWNLFDGSPRGTWAAFGDAITGLGVTADGRLLATGRSDSRLRVRDLTLAESKADIELGLGYIANFQLSSDDRFLAVAGDSAAVSILEIGEQD